MCWSWIVGGSGWKVADGGSEVGRRCGGRGGFGWSFGVRVSVYG